ncbi:MAG: hypothetical protein CMJ94_12825 [Planctomycetes bacterium]|nr:hypothetical protein [Planctomycetota bacterium]
MRIQNVAFLPLVLATSVSAMHEWGWKAPQNASVQLLDTAAMADDVLVCAIDIHCGDLNAALRIIKNDDETKLVLLTPTDRKVLKFPKGESTTAEFTFECDGQPITLSISPEAGKSWDEVESCSEIQY